MITVKQSTLKLVHFIFTFVLDFVFINAVKEYLPETLLRFDLTRKI